MFLMKEEEDPEWDPGMSESGRSYTGDYLMKMGLNAGQILHSRVLCMR